jgi:hypothetical protein
MSLVSPVPLIVTRPALLSRDPTMTAIAPMACMARTCARARECASARVRSGERERNGEAWGGTAVPGQYRGRKVFLGPARSTRHSCWLAAASRTGNIHCHTATASVRATTQRRCAAYVDPRAYVWIVSLHVSKGCVCACARIVGLQAPLCDYMYMCMV